MSGIGQIAHTAFNFSLCIRRSGGGTVFRGGGGSSSSDEISITSVGSSFGFGFLFLFVVEPEVRFTGLCGGDGDESGASEDANSSTPGGVFSRIGECFWVKGEALERPPEVVGEVCVRGIDCWWVAEGQR